MNMKITTYNGAYIQTPQSFVGTKLLALPALIDCHVHFRTPGQEYKEDWGTGANAALAGGVSTVLDMPNNIPSCTTFELVKNKKQLITETLASHHLPIHPFVYIGATNTNREEIRRAKQEIVGIKVFLGSSTGNLLVDSPTAQEAVFKLGAELDLTVAVHAEEEELIQKNKIHFSKPTLSDHSRIRSNTVAERGVKRAIELCRTSGATTYILHVSTPEELALIRAAKAEGLPLYAEATPHHLFLTIEDYERLGTLAQVNPPLRSRDDQQALWEAVVDGTIDTIGSDHAPHTLDEKSRPYPEAPSGMPGIETTLPLLLSAYHDHKISLERIVELTHTNPRKIFHLPETNDWTIVDLDLVKQVRNEDLKTKCGWSPFATKTLHGWPIGIVWNTVAL